MMVIIVLDSGDGRKDLSYIYTAREREREREIGKEKSLLFQLSQKSFLSFLNKMEKIRKKENGGERILFKKIS
jgi:hypothetical protein